MGVGLGIGVGVRVGVGLEAVVGARGSKALLRHRRGIRGGGGGPLAAQVEADDAEARPEVQLHARAHLRSRRAAGDGRSSRRDRCGDLGRRALRSALEKLAAAVLGRVRRLRDDP